MENCENKLILGFEVVRKHLFIDKKYILQLYENKLLIRENVQNKVTIS